MSSLREWNEILEEINSEKIKERADGISRVRVFLSSTRQFNALSADPSHNWLRSLQDLFNLVIEERNGILRKHSAPAEKRLEQAATLVRWVVEKVHLVLSRKARKAVFAHLVQMIPVKGKLQGYALTYLRTIRHLLSYPPHLEHLHSDVWTDIVALCFAGVLGDKIRIGKEYIENAAMDVGEDGVFEGSLRLTDEDDREPVTRKTASQEDIELVACIETAFRSKSAPFLQYSTVIFRKFLRFFRQFESETTAHLPALTALVRAFAELDLNDQEAMRELGPQLWPHILELWSTKNASLKEQVVMALRYLSPFVTFQSPDESLVDTKIKPLFDAILSEPTIRWRESFELDLDLLRVGVDAGSGATTQPQAFHSSTFRIGSGFSEKQAVAWVLLELGADCLAKLYVLSEVVRPVADLSPTPKGSGRNKRRKLEEPLSALVDSLLEELPSNVVVFRIQLLLFLVERHWSALHLAVCQRILRTLISLLAHDDLRIQSWAFLAVAAVSHVGMPSELVEGAAPRRNGRDTLSRTPGEWDQVWTVAMRRISNPIVSRVASHASNVLLATDRIDPVKVASSVEAFTRDLDVQGPNFPSDAVCTFLGWCLSIASSDVRLFRLGLPDKVYTWLSTAWKPLDGVVRAHSIGQTRPRADPLSPSHLVTLIAQVCGNDHIPALRSTPSDFLIPDCPSASLAIDMCETAPVRDFIQGRVPPIVKEDVASSRAPQSAKSVQKVQGGTERKVSAWLARLLASVSDAGEDAGEHYWTTMGSEMVRRHLDLAAVALTVEGMFELDTTRPDKTTIKAACVLLSHLVPTLALKKWRPHERAYVLGGLKLLLVPLPDYPSISFPVLLDPGPCSGVPRALLPNRQPHSVVIDFDSLESSLLRKIWSSPTTRSVLEEIATSLHSVLKGVPIVPPPSDFATQGAATQAASTQRARELEEAEEEDDDEFGEIKVSRTSQLAGTTSSERAESACAAACVRGLVSAALAESQAVGSVRVPQLVDAIVQSDGLESIVVAEQVFTAVWTGLVTFRLAEAEQILQHLGNTFLTGYRYSLDERVALAALRFLECTATSWILADGSQAAGDFAKNARALCGWLTNNREQQTLPSWRVRTRLIAFLDIYLSIDRTQTRWDVGEHATRAADGSALLPTDILPSTLLDVDFRVRFRAGTSAPALFTFFHENGLSSNVLYAALNKIAVGNLDAFEGMLTQILCNSNMIIASANNRRAPYAHLLDVARNEPHYSPIIAATLTGAAHRLGLRDLATLYLFHSRYYVCLRDLKGLDEAMSPPIPFVVCGFSSLLELRKADLVAVGSFLLAGDQRDSFQTACNVVKESTEACALRCLADAIAITVLRGFTGRPPGNDFSDIHARIKALVEEAGALDAEQAETVVSTMADEVVAGMLCMLYEREWAAGSVPAALASDKRVGQTFKSLLSSSHAISLAEACPPYYALQVVVDACAWFGKELPVFNRPSAVFAIVHRLFVRVHRSPFVDEQRRLLVATALALALSTRVVKDATILGTLAESLVVLLPQVDLATIVAGMLRWCFTEWLSLGDAMRNRASDFGESVIRAAHACQALLESQLDEEVRLAIIALAKFLEESLQPLEELAPSVASEARLLWPSSQVDPSAVSLDSIEAALSSSLAPHRKFGLVQFLKGRPDFALQSGTRRTIWRLLESMLVSDIPGIEDCIALSDLLYDVCGEVDSPGLDDLASSLARKEGLESAIGGEGDVKQLVVARVLEFVHAPNTELVHLAVRAIRALFSVTPTSKLYTGETLPPRSLGIASFLASPKLLRPKTARTREPRSLKELAKSSRLRGTRDYKRWARELAQLLADYRAKGDPFYAQLVPIFAGSVEASAILLPLLVHSILIQGASAQDDTSRDELSSHFSELLSDPSTASECVGTVVNIAIYLRRHRKPDQTSASSCNGWLSTSWILLAEGAVKTGAHFTALLFLELAHEHEGLFQPGTSSQRRQQDDRAQALLYDIYAAIDDPDGFYGRQAQDVGEALVRRYEHEGRWGDAFRVYGSAYEGQSGRTGAFLDLSATPGVVQSLASTGFNRLAMAILQPARTEGAVREESLKPGLPYELGWRTETWDLPIEKRSAGSSSVALYSSLRSVHAARDPAELQAIVDSATLAETSKLALVSLDVPTPNEEALSTLLSLREIRRWPTLEAGEGLSPEVATSLPVIPPSLNFVLAERILSIRISLLRAVRTQEEVDQIGELTSGLYQQATQAEKSCLVQLSRAARAGGHLQASMNAVTLARKLVEPGAGTFEVDEEFAHVLWVQQEHSIAIELLKSVVAPSAGTRALVLARLGAWTAEARIKNSRDVSETYFDPAVAALAEGCSPLEIGQVHGAYAAFADAQYLENLKATDVKRTRYELYAQRKEAEFVEIDRQLKTYHDLKSLQVSQLKKSKRDAQQHLEEDKRQLDDAKATTNLMLQRALDNYAKALTASDAQDDQIHRFCALWLEHSGDDELHKKLVPLLAQIPSFKFVFLAYQLSARLSKLSQPTPFATNITKLVVRLGSDHPFHTLFPVYALREASADGKSSRGRRSSAAADLGSQSGRAKAAEEVFVKVKKVARLTQRVESLELACSAYSEWANFKVSRDDRFSTAGQGDRRHMRKGPHQIPKDLKLLTRVVNLPIPVSTFDVPIDHTCEYPAANLPCIVKYGSVFLCPGGVHVPKIVTCHASDGKEYRQLFKGEDDIRQDAVMEQTFVLINSLLDRDEGTRRRNLRIRTYKVIPLPGATGVIEFVANTSSLGDVLLPLYSKYRTTISIQTARDTLRKIEGQNKEDRDAKKDVTFPKILKGLPPLMRHFFFQKHKLPSLWFEMRLNYSRSVATTSIVGHIAGLGDRHVSNILMDEVQGDLILIDLGIAFDQGKRLPIAELVPFRLTQNIIDGFGMNGVDGVFRRCAEETLRVLRERSSVVMTVLEVFKHDPLQSWSISADMAKKIQGTDDGEAGTLDALPDDADRALSIVAEKLDKKLSVEYTVNQLIQQATDPQNLGRIFSGWQPYL